MLGRQIRLLISAAILIAMLNRVPAAFAAPDPCANRVNNTHAKLLECVTLTHVLQHQATFQAIANANGGTRAAGTPGYDASLEYIEQRMIAAGYNVTLNTFPFTFFPPAVLQQLTPVNATYETGTFTGSGSGDVTGSVVP